MAGIKLAWPNHHAIQGDGDGGGALRTAGGNGFYSRFVFWFLVWLSLDSSGSVSGWWLVGNQ